MSGSGPRDQDISGSVITAIAKGRDNQACFLIPLRWGRFVSLFVFSLVENHSRVHEGDYRGLRCGQQGPATASRHQLWGSLDGFRHFSSS